MSARQKQNSVLKGHKCIFNNSLVFCCMYSKEKKSAVDSERMANVWIVNALKGFVLRVSAQ